MGYSYLNVRVNSANDASISCKNFRNCGPVIPEKTGLICVLFYNMAKKMAYLVKYLRTYWPDFYNFFTKKSALGADDRALHRFRIFEETLPWQSTDYGKMS